MVELKLVIDPGDMLAFMGSDITVDTAFSDGLHKQLLCSSGVHEPDEGEPLIYVGLESHSGRFWFLSARFGLCFKVTDTYLRLVRRSDW